MLKCIAALEVNKIYCRRYFYPALSHLPYVQDQILPVCEDISDRILCLPLYHTLTFADINYIARIILRIQNYQETPVIDMPVNLQIELDTILKTKEN